LSLSHLPPLVSTLYTSEPALTPYFPQIVFYNVNNSLHNSFFILFILIFSFYTPIIFSQLSNQKTNIFLFSISPTPPLSLYTPNAQYQRINNVLKKLIFIIRLILYITLIFLHVKVYQKSAFALFISSLLFTLFSLSRPNPLKRELFLLHFIRAKVTKNYSHSISFFTLFLIFLFLSSILKNAQQTVKNKLKRALYSIKLCITIARWK
jgi:hypothetical protein